MSVTVLTDRYLLRALTSEQERSCHFAERQYIKPIRLIWVNPA